MCGGDIGMEGAGGCSKTDSIFLVILMIGWWVKFILVCLLYII